MVEISRAVSLAGSRRLQALVPTIRTNRYRTGVGCSRACLRPGASFEGLSRLPPLKLLALPSVFLNGNRQRLDGTNCNTG
jgi:hypothetical protein